MMKDSLLVDPTFAEFNEMSRLASNVNGLYDKHDGRELRSDISTWDDNYMDKLMVQVVGNFSKERLDHLKDIVKYLRPVATLSQSKSTNLQPRKQQVQENNYQKQKRNDQRNGNFRGVKIAAGTVVGGVVGGTITGVAGGSVIIGVAAGAVLVSAAVALATNGE